MKKIVAVILSICIFSCFLTVFADDTANTEDSSESSSSEVVVDSSSSESIPDSSSSSTPQTTTIKAKYYVHLTSNVDEAVTGSKPQPSTNYFPPATQGLERDIYEPSTSVPTNTGTYSNGNSWYTWNGTTLISSYLINPPTISDFTVPSNAVIEGDPSTWSITWYVIKDQEDGWHVDGCIKGYMLYNLHYDLNNPNEINDITGTINDRSGLKMDETVELSPIPEKVGYTFLGWSKSKGGPVVSSIVIGDDQLARVDYTYTVYARWTKNTSESSSTSSSSSIDSSISNSNSISSESTPTAFSSSSNNSVSSVTSSSNSESAVITDNSNKSSSKLSSNGYEIVDDKTPLGFLPKTNASITNGCGIVIISILLILIGTITFISKKNRK